MNCRSDVQVIDLFSGIGGFSLAAHSLGWRTALFCECEPYATRVLRRHFPDVPVFDDVRTLDASTVQEVVPSGAVRLLTAGFPCQDISYAGKGAGLEGARSGLFYEVARLVGEVRPDWVLLENVAGILTRGVDAVCGTMASMGYGFTYGCVRASDVGAPHRRDRWWLVAWPSLGDERDIERGRRLADAVLGRLTPWGSGESWPTATASDAWAHDKNRNQVQPCTGRVLTGKAGLGLGQAARGDTWPTPTGDDANNVTRDSGAFQSLTRSTQEQQVIGSLNPAWVETLMGVPIGYTLPEGEPMLTLPSVWPVDSPDGRGWMTPKSQDGEWGKPRCSNRPKEMSTHLATQIDCWPAGMGAPQHPWEPPRLTTEKEHRAARLRCLGNGIVPHVARLWMMAIQEECRYTSPRHPEKA